MSRNTVIVVRRLTELLVLFCFWGLAPAAGAVSCEKVGGPYCLEDTGFTGFSETMGVGSNGVAFVDTTTYQDPAGVSALAHLIPGVISSNGRSPWRDVSPTIGPIRAHPNTNDPYLYLDPRTNRLFNVDTTFAYGTPAYAPTCAQISFSDNGGRSWTNSSEGCLENSFEKLFAGPPPTGLPQIPGVTKPVGYPDVIYYCAPAVRPAEVPFGAETGCEKSLDGGLTFLPITPPYSDASALASDPTDPPRGDFGLPGLCDGFTDPGVVGPDGTIYLPRDWCGEPYLAISHDEGTTWKRVQVADNGMPINDFGAREHAASLSLGPGGALFYFYIAHNRLPYLVVSRDAGNHWSQPVRVGPPDLTEAALPAAAAETVGGHLAVAFMGSTNSPRSPFPEIDDCTTSLERCVSNGAVADSAEAAHYQNVTWNGYISVSDHPFAASPSFQTTAVNDPADPLHRGPCDEPQGCGATGDFIDVVLDRHGNPWGAFVKGCTGPCVTAGSQDNRAGGHGEVVIAVPRAVAFSSRRRAGG